VADKDAGAMADALVRLLESAAERTSLSHAASRYVRGYNRLVQSRLISILPRQPPIRHFQSSSGLLIAGGAEIAFTREGSAPLKRPLAYQYKLGLISTPGSPAPSASAPAGKHYRLATGAGSNKQVHCANDSRT